MGGFGSSLCCSQLIHMLVKSSCVATWELTRYFNITLAIRYGPGSPAEAIFLSRHPQALGCYTAYVCGCLSVERYLISIY